MKHEEVDSEDWFTDWQVVNYLVDKEENINGQITEDYCKTLEKLKSPFSQRKMSSSEKKNEFLALVVTIFLFYYCNLLRCLFVHKQIYSFPARPFSSTFSVNIAFTLFVLPILTVIFIHISKNYLKFLEFHLLFQSVFVLAFLNRLLKV